MRIVLLILLVAVLLGGLPPLGLHPYGLWPSSTAGILLLIIIVLVLSERL